VVFDQRNLIKFMLTENRLVPRDGVFKIKR